MVEAKIHYLCVGNPGVGKSTILNGLINDPTPRFKSGFSPGKGLSSALQREEHHGHVFMDTPGLADVEMRKQATEAISEALKQNGVYKVIFVVTLEGGRVRPADRDTMKLVLEAAPEIGSNYGVIFNKVSPSAIRRMSVNPQEKNDILDALFNGITRTTYVFNNQMNTELEDADNMVRPLPEGLRRFIEGVPPIRITPGQVEDLKNDQFDELKGKLDEQMERMRRDNESLRKKMLYDQEQHARQLAQWQEEAKRQAELQARQQAELRARQQAELRDRQQAELEARQQAELSPSELASLMATIFFGSRGRQRR